MKLSGNKKNGRHIGAAARTANPARSSIAGGSRGGNHKNEKPEDPKAVRAAMKKKRARRARRVTAVVLLVLIALSVFLYSMYKVGLKPPDQKPKPPVGAPADPSQKPEGTAPGSTNDRKSKYTYTFLVLGMDDGNGNTDTIMAANFDAVNHTLNVVNIPRDTLVNVKWNPKKANTLYAMGGIDGVVDGLSKVLGFHVDFYVIVDLAAFKKLVNAVDGVDFNVPVDMRYSDPVQNLEINLRKGMQHLDGDKALQLVRCRNVYASADIGRIETQQSFLKAAAEQILQKQDKLDIAELADIFLTNVKTDLNLGNVGWLAREFYKMDASNITFQTLPANYNDSVNGASYVTIHIDEWLQLLNDKINPFVEDIKAEDLSIYTRDSNGKLYVTDGNYAGKASWGTGTAASSGSSAPKPSPSPSPSPSPAESPEPAGEPSGPDTSPTPGAEAPPDGGNAASTPGPDAAEPPGPDAPETPDAAPEPAESPVQPG